MYGVYARGRSVGNAKGDRGECHGVTGDRQLGGVVVILNSDDNRTITRTSQEAT